MMKYVDWYNFHWRCKECNMISISIQFGRGRMKVIFPYCHHSVISLTLIIHPQVLWSLHFASFPVSFSLPCFMEWISTMSWTPKYIQYITRNITAFTHNILAVHLLPGYSSMLLLCVALLQKQCQAFQVGQKKEPTPKGDKIQSISFFFLEPIGWSSRFLLNKFLSLLLENAWWTYFARDGCKAAWGQMDEVTDFVSFACPSATIALNFTYLLMVVRRRWVLNICSTERATTCFNLVPILDVIAFVFLHTLRLFSANEYFTIKS